MIFVANTSLKMGAGKLAAQVGHATLGVYLNATKTKEVIYFYFIVNLLQGKNALRAWETHGQMKVVVKGENTEHLEQLSVEAQRLGLFPYLVHDAGRTQIAAGSTTVLGMFGSVEEVDKVTGSLKLM